MTPDEIVEVAFRGKISLIHRPALVHLLTMAQAAPLGNAVELGVYRASSLVMLAMAREGMGECIGVDDWSYPDPPNLEQLALDTINFHHVQVSLMSMTSDEAAAVIPGPLAFVHIDANHTYEFVKRDIANWMPKLMPGGIVAFHDYGAKRHFGVKQAIDEWQAREPWECLGEVLTTIGFRKP